MFAVAVYEQERKTREEEAAQKARQEGFRAAPLGGVMHFVEPHPHAA